MVLEAMARGTLVLLTDRAKLAELSRRGRVRAGEFSWARTARETAAVDRELL